jgi:hypothetical protein
MAMGIFKCQTCKKKNVCINYFLMVSKATITTFNILTVLLIKYFHKQ